MENPSPPVIDDLTLPLKRHFGLDRFRPGQRDAIESILARRDCVAILPTGGGKSLLYQLPAAIEENGVTLVISPLIALMKDQTDRLNGLGIPAMYCNSSQDELEQRTALSRAVTGKIKLLYISPERALSKSFLSLVTKMDVRLVAIDEAHCISQWGNDFRPEYKKLALLRKQLATSPPWIAVTATAPQRIVEEIVADLRLDRPLIVRGSFYRPNLTFSVQYPATDSEKGEKIRELLRERGFQPKRPPPGRAIIYCATRKSVDLLYKELKQERFSVGRYHAGIGSAMRTRTHDAYLNGSCPILIATGAFGMGMDSPDVRLIIHYHHPASLESYYQEAGRAGRDGAESDCILFFRKGDGAIHRFLARKEKSSDAKEPLLIQMQSYAIKERCRQLQLCAHFGENIEPCGKCDICEDRHEHKSERSAFQTRERQKEEKRDLQSSVSLSDADARHLLSFIRIAEGRFGKTAIADFVHGSKQKKIKTYAKLFPDHYGSLSRYPVPSIRKTLERWTDEAILETTGKKYPKLIVAGTAPAIRSSRKAAAKPKKTTVESELLRELKNFRDREARKLKWKKFMVIQNEAMREIARVHPVTIEELRQIRGIGESKLVRFGEAILNIVRNRVPE